MSLNTFLSFQPGSLDDVMFSAIQLNRADFVDLFLDHGVNLKDFLTPQRLLSLYGNVRITAEIMLDQNKHRLTKLMLFD